MLISCAEKEDYSLEKYSTKPEIITDCWWWGFPIHSQCRAFSYISDYDLISDAVSEVGHCWIYGSGEPNIESNLIVSTIVNPTSYWDSRYSHEYHFESIIGSEVDSSYSIRGYMRTKAGGIIYGSTVTLNPQ